MASKKIEKIVEEVKPQEKPVIRTLFNGNL